MLRVAQLLSRSYSLYGYRVDLIHPPVWFGSLPLIPSRIRKYLGYLDKLIVFPPWLFVYSRRYDLVHIADHSNSFYSFFLRPDRTILICHDLLAIRGAMGDPTAFCDASSFGIWLQRLIMAGLRRPRAVSFISKATLNDFERLIGCPDRQRHSVTHLPLNASFERDVNSESVSQSEFFQRPSKPFLLMVGSALPRKNRALALDLLEQLGHSSPYSLVFAGEPLTSAEQHFQTRSPYGARLVSIVSPSHAMLNFLYCQAHALLFPSFSEGFGWPLIEAQASGCPVIASTTTSIPEVAGDGALFADPTDIAAFRLHVLSLEDSNRRAWLVQEGYANCQRFTPERFAEAITTFAFQQ